MSVDPREQLWEVAFITHYDAMYEEFLAAALMRRWQVFDVLYKILAALTASGSAICGWALWERPQWKVSWAVIAGIAAVLTVIHTRLGVSTRFEEQAQSRAGFATLRIALETFRMKMAIDPDFPLNELKSEFYSFRERYAEHFNAVPNDILCTKRLKNCVQDEVNTKLADQIQE